MYVVSNCIQFNIDYTTQPIYYVFGFIVLCLKENENVTDP